MTRASHSHGKPPRLRVLCYHDLAEESSWTRGLRISTPPELFESQVKYLSRHYDLVSPSDLAGDLPPRPLLFTFDDAYKSVFEVGLPVLSSQNVAAAFFVSTDPVCAGLPLIDNVAAFASAEGLPDPPAAPDVSGSEEVCLEEGRRDRLLGELRMTPKQFMSEVADYASYEDLDSLHQSGWLLGGHTASHCVLGRVPSGCLARQIVASMDLLPGSEGDRWFALPYGSPSDYTVEVSEVLKAAEVSRVFFTTGRANLFRTSGCFYRTTISDDGLAQIRRRLEADSILKWAKPLVKSALGRGGSAA